ncbi:MAG: hypothetical protein WBC44_05920 [Planctomycetaceae bacterium]
MKQLTCGFLASFFALRIVSGHVAADEPKDPQPQPKELRQKLVGTWKLVSAKYGGAEFQFPEGTTMVKHVTPTHFMWATYGEDGTVSRAAGGSYTLEGDAYKESIKYGMGDDFNVIQGQTHAFTCKIEGNTWKHNGELAGGLTIEEDWKRVEAK